MLSWLINMGKIITGIHGLESFTKLAKSRGICIYLIVWKPSLKSVWVLYEPGKNFSKILFGRISDPRYVL